MKAHRRCLYSKYCKYPSVKEPQTSQPRLMWNLQSPWDIANISCVFFPSPDSIHMLTTDVCKAFSPKKESFFSCPVFVLHKIWGLAALKKNKTQTQPRRVSGGDRAAACWQQRTCMQISSGRPRGTSAGAASNKEPAAPESLYRQKEKDERGREGGLPGVRARGGFVGTIADPTRAIASQGEERNSASVEDAWFKSATNHATCGLNAFCLWTRPVSPIRVAGRHLSIWRQHGWGLDWKCWLSATSISFVYTNESMVWEQRPIHPWVNEQRC